MSCPYELTNCYLWYITVDIINIMMYEVLFYNIIVHIYIYIFYIFMDIYGHSEYDDGVWGKKSNQPASLLAPASMFNSFNSVSIGPALCLVLLRASLQAAIWHLTRRISIEHDIFRVNLRDVEHHKLLVTSIRTSKHRCVFRVLDGFVRFMIRGGQLKNVSKNNTTQHHHAKSVLVSCCIAVALLCTICKIQTFSKHGTMGRGAWKPKLTDTNRLGSFFTGSMEKPNFIDLFVQGT